MRAAPYVALAWLVAAPLAAAETMTFSVRGAGNCCAWIAGEGAITASTPADFQAFVARTSFVPRTLYLASPGGSVTASMELGRMIRKLQFTTFVGLSHRLRPDEDELKAGDCLSACVFAYAGGLYRYYQDPGIDYMSRAPGSRLGVHQASFRSEAAIVTSPAAREVAATLGVQAGQFIAALEIAYMVEMGVDPAIIGLASSIPANRMHVLTEEEAQKYKLALPFDRKPHWALQAFQHGIMLTGDGVYSQQNYQASLWCINQKTGQMVLSMTLAMWPGDPAPQKRAKDAEKFNYNLEFKIGQGASDFRDIAVPSARAAGGAKQVTVSMTLPPQAMELIAGGVAFRINSDASRADQIWPYAYFSVPPVYVTLLRRACTG